MLCKSPRSYSPAGGRGKVKHATGFALQLGSAFTHYEIHLKKSEEVNWQLDSLRLFNPQSRVVRGSAERNRVEIAGAVNVRLPAVEGSNQDGKDIVIMGLSPEEAGRLLSASTEALCQSSAVKKWRD